MLSCVSLFTELLKTLYNVQVTFRFVGAFACSYTAIKIIPMSQFLNSTYSNFQSFEPYFILLIASIKETIISTTQKTSVIYDNFFQLFELNSR